MNLRFLKLLSQLHACHKRLMRMKPVTFATLVSGNVPKRGVYLFSEDRKALYVGRSNGICKRIGRHCGRGATWRQAAFAFRLAREATGNLKATYRKEGGRRALAIDPAFTKTFRAAKERISKMQVRYVEEADPLRQTLLEMYVAVVLKTPYNSFDNH
jgi:predicted GIY-YIG superfamily endonuclease